MLQVSKMQLQLLDAAGAVRQDARMCLVVGNALSGLLPDVDMSLRQPQLAQLVELGCERAAQLGIEEEGDMAAVVALQLARTLLPVEDQDKLRQWATAPLQRNASSGRVKVALVELTLQRLAPSQPLAQRLQAMVADIRAAYA